MSIKSSLKKITPRLLHHLCNRIVSRHRIAGSLGDWFDTDWKKKADDADSSTWVELYDRSWEHCDKQDLSVSDIIKIRNKIPLGSTLLDCGCGDGYLLKNLASRCGLRSGIDISRLALYRAQKRLGKGVPLLQTFLEALPFSDNSFDVIVCAHTLEHVRNLDRSISEMKRVATKKLLILVPCQEYLPHTEDYHIHFFPDEKTLLKKVNIVGAVCERYHFSDEIVDSEYDCCYRGDILLLTADLS